MRTGLTKKQKTTLTFEIEKGRLSFRLTAPYSEERRRAASKCAKQNNVHK